MRVTCGPNIDVYEITEENVAEMFTIFGPIVDGVTELVEEIANNVK